MMFIGLILWSTLSLDYDINISNIFLWCLPGVVFQLQVKSLSKAGLMSSVSSYSLITWILQPNTIVNLLSCQRWNVRICPKIDPKNYAILC